MRKVIAVLVVLMFISPAMAMGQQSAEKARTSLAACPDNLFQNAWDTLDAWGHPQQPQATDRVAGFQETADQIKSWDAYSRSAKPLSLRGNKAELAKRRNALPSSAWY